MLSRDDVIHSIRRINPTVPPEFLTRFDYRQLRAYLSRLEETAATCREIEQADELPDPPLLVPVAS